MLCASQDVAQHAHLAVTICSYDTSLEQMFAVLLPCSVHVGDTANIVTSMAVDGDCILTGKVQIGQQVLPSLLNTPTLT